MDTSAADLRRVSGSSSSWRLCELAMRVADMDRGLGISRWDSVAARARGPEGKVGDWMLRGREIIEPPDLGVETEDADVEAEDSDEDEEDSETDAAGA